MNIAIKKIDIFYRLYYNINGDLNMIITSVRHDWPEKKGFTLYRPNGHKDYTFLHFMCHAQLRIDGKVFDMQPGGCIFYTPQTQQWFHTETTLIHNWLHANKKIANLLYKFGIPENEIFYPNQSSFISKIFHQLEVEYFSENDNKEILMDTYLNEFLIKLSRAINNNSNNNNSINNIDKNLRTKMRDLRRHILSNPEYHWTVSEMANQIALSPSRFHTIYKAIFASSPTHDLITARVDYASSLLISHPEKPISEIAEMSGYSDQYHFIRQFKSITGTTPGVYKRSFIK